MGGQEASMMFVAVVLSLKVLGLLVEFLWQWLGQVCLGGQLLVGVEQSASGLSECHDGLLEGDDHAG